MLAMLLYNLFLFLALRDKASLSYVAFLAAQGLLWTAAGGMGLDYLWPDQPVFNHQCTFYLAILSALSGAWFTRAFLHTEQHLAQFDGVLRLLMGASAMALLLGALDAWPFAEDFLVLAVTANATALLGVGLLVARLGQRSARYYLLSWLPLLAGVAGFALVSLQLVQETFWTRYGVMTGGALQLAVLSLGLADRLKALRKEQHRLEGAQQALSLIHI